MFGSALAASAFEWSAGGRADSVKAESENQVALPSFLASTAADPPVDPQLTYWHKLAVKRLRLLGARERRIVKLLTRLRAKGVRGNSGLNPASLSPASIICRVFGSYCRQAISVARCESGLSIYARNGQYLGLFQMGSFARSTYGHGWDAWTQSRAAYRYFVASGRDWSPWTCKP
jgi:hypothetical protein